MITPATLPEGNPESKGARFIVRELEGATRLAGPCVTVGAIIDFQGEPGKPIFFLGASPFDVENPQIGNSYTVKNQAPAAYNFIIEDSACRNPEIYQINVRSEGIGQTVFNYSDGKLKACQFSLDSVFFLRREFNEPAYEGEIWLNVSQHPPDYSGPTYMRIPSSQANGYWTPNARGIYTVKLVQPSSTLNHDTIFEDVGSDEGDLVVDPIGGIVSSI